MGWWKRVEGRMVCESAVEDIADLERMGQVFVTPTDFPWHVREKLEAFYLGGVGRKPTDGELLELLELLAFDR